MFEANKRFFLNFVPMHWPICLHYLASIGLDVIRAFHSIVSVILFL